MQCRNPIIIGKLVFNGGNAVPAVEGLVHTAQNKAGAWCVEVAALHRKFAFDAFAFGEFNFQTIFAIGDAQGATRPGCGPRDFGSARTQNNYLLRKAICLKRVLAHFAAKKAGKRCAVSCRNLDGVACSKKVGMCTYLAVFSVDLRQEVQCGFAALRGELVNFYAETGNLNRVGQRSALHGEAVLHNTV